MNIVAVLLFLLTSTAAGFALVRHFDRDLSRSEILAWSFGVGLLVQAVIELALLAASEPPGPKKLLAGEAALVLVSFLLRPPARGEPGSHRPRSGSRIVTPALLCATAGALLFFCAAAATPMWTTDFLAIWGLKGKTIYETAAVPGHLFHDPAFVWTHPEYPLLLPLTFAALAAAARSWDDQALALIYPVCQWATLLLLWGFLARRASRTAAAAAVILTGLCFPLYASVNVGTAEILMAFGFVLASAAAADATTGESVDARLRLAAAALFCAGTKQEGALFISLLAVFLLARRQARHRAVWLWAGLPLAIHGAALRLLRGPVLRKDFDLTLLAPDRWAELLSRLVVVTVRLATVEARRAAIPLAAIVLFLLVTRRSPFDWLAAPLAAQVAAYALLCALSSVGPIWHVEASFARITVALLPAATLVLASRLATVMGPRL